MTCLFFLAVLNLFAFIIGILYFYNDVVSKISLKKKHYLLYLVLPVSVDLCQFWKLLRHYHVDHFSPSFHLEVYSDACLTFFSSHVYLFLNFHSYFPSPNLSVLNLGYFFRAFFLFTNFLFSSHVPLNLSIDI